MDSTLSRKGFLRLPQVLSLIPISKSSWWSGVAQGKFPKPIKLGPRTTAWKTEDIEQLLYQFASYKNDKNKGFCIQCEYFYLVKLSTRKIKRICRFSQEQMNSTTIPHGCKVQHIMEVADV